MKSIFSRLILSFLAIILIAILTISISFSGLLRNYLTRQSETQLENKGKQIVSLSRDYLNRNIDERTFSYVINSMDEIVNSRTLIVDRAGFIVSSPSRDKLNNSLKGLKFDRNDMIQILKGYTITRSGYSLFFNETMITVGIPIFSNEKSSYVIGAIILNSPVTGVTEALNKMALMLFGAGSAALIFSLIIAYFLSKTLSRPIHSIANAAMEIAEGNYSARVDINRKDEIGKLSSTFNYLTEKLRNTIGDLYKEKRKLSDILYSMDEGLIAVDLDLNIIHANPAAATLTGIDTSFNAKLSGDICGHEMISNIQHVLKNGKNKSYQTNGVEDRVLNVLISPLKYQNDMIYGAIIIIQDISESVKLEKMRRDFVANVSHELRTPLTAIRGFIEPLIDGTVDDDSTRSKYHKIIRDETLRLERLINDLLDLSRLQAGKIKLDIQKVDVAELISNVSAKFKPLIDSKKIEFRFEKHDKPLFILADGDRIEQLIIIFLDNAIKYTPPGGNIYIGIIEENDVLRISIRDTGTGIPEEDLPYIWDRFYKVDKSRTGKASGTGIGLSIAKNIIDLHGQNVSVKSKPGEGSVFEFTMPKA